MEQQAFSDAGPTKHQEILELEQLRQLTAAIEQRVQQLLAEREASEAPRASFSDSDARTNRRIEELERKIHRLEKGKEPVRWPSPIIEEEDPIELADRQNRGGSSKMSKGTKRQRSPSPSDSGNYDSDGSDPRKRYRRSGITPPERSQKTLSATPVQVKETPCPDPPKFDMRRGADVRPYLEGCETYIRLKSNRFPCEEAKILWALGFLEGEKAKNWARSYRRKMYRLDEYMSWSFFKSKTTDRAGHDTASWSKHFDGKSDQLPFPYAPSRDRVFESHSANWPSRQDHRVNAGLRGPIHDACYMADLEEGWPCL
ncbi:MAG: hypothetical protein DME65_14250 [Verrucomicrobia bacterium]|nr:MAG: hypothetical protein DME65_14250 [Verrucomicrobiota bacterium]